MMQVDAKITNVEIGKLLGYTVESQMYNDSDETFYYLLDPNRKPVIHIDARMMIMLDGERQVVEDFRNEERAWQDLPYWIGSVDAALALPIDHDNWFYTMMFIDSHGYAVATIYPYDMNNPARFQGYGNSGNLALAICSAWLQWRNANESATSS